MHLTGRAPRARVGLALVFAVATTQRPAAARPNETDAEAYTAALTRAIAAKERALDVNEPPRWEEALRLFQEAAALRDTRECAYEIGVAAERLSRHDLAVEAYEAAVDLGLIGPPRTRAQTFVSAHASVMARLTVRGPAGRVVNVAGVRRGRLPLQRPLVLFPGEVRLEIAGPGDTINSVTIRLRGGQLEVLDLDRQTPAAKPPVAEANPPAPPPVAPRPAAEGDTDLLPLPPRPADGRPAANGPTSPDRPEVDVSSRGIWIAGIGATIAIAAAILLTVSSSKIQSDRDALPAKCYTAVVNDACLAQPMEGPVVQSLVDSIATWKAIRTGAYVGLGVGAAALAGGILLRVHDGAVATSARPTLVIDRGGGPTQLGLAWTLRF